LKRQDWIYVLPLDAQSGVLCVGEEAARMSAPLSGIVDRVVVGIPRDRGDRIIGRGAGRDAMGGLHVVVVDGASPIRRRMPFRSEAFDIVFCAQSSGFAPNCMADLRGLVRPGGWIVLLGRTRQRWVPRAHTFRVKALKKAGWGSARSYWVYPDFHNCQWIMPLDDRENVVACLDLLIRDRSLLRQAGFRVLSALVRSGFPLGPFAANVVVMARDDASGHT
jgi:hypothetical protein